MSLKRQGSFKVVTQGKRTKSAPDVTLVPVRKRKARMYRAMPEIKASDVAITAQTLTASTAYVALINPLGQGTNFNARVGNKVHGRYIQIKMAIFQGNGGSLASVRVIVVQDLGYNTSGLAPAWTDVMATATMPETGKLWTTSERFKILRDDYYADVGNANQSVLSYDKYIDISNCVPSQYVGTSGLQASIGSGAYYLMILSDQNIALTSGTSSLRSGWNAYTRFAFVDN